MIGAKARKPNPMLDLFGPLIGVWRTKGAHPYIPDTELRGQTSFEWIEGGAFVMMRTEVDHPKIPDGIAMFGSDDSAGTWYMIYFDERGVSRKYDVTITENQLVYSRDDPHLSQRMTIDIGNDTLTGHGEMSVDGGAWEKDLSMVYEKLAD